MKTLTLRNRFQGNSTIVENDFIDHYMTKANGEYVKVYLLLLRHLNDPSISLTISKLADCLDCTEKDILRALKHWSKVGLLKIDYDEAGTICGLTMGQNYGATTSSSQAESVKLATDDLVRLPAQEKSSAPENISTTEEFSPSTKTRKKSSTKNSVTSNTDKLRQLYFVAEQYMGKPLSATEIQRINYFHDSLNFSTDLIEYLIEYCVENGHKSMRYIETVALAWSDEGISSVAEAKANSSLYNKNCFTVLKAFGISGRNPAPIEVGYIKKWTDEYGFDISIILEACNRTISNTAKPDFKYADKILKNWLAQGVHHLSDITRLDMERRQEQVAKKKTTSNSVVIANNRFNNFEGRKLDISSLEQQLLNTK